MIKINPLNRRDQAAVEGTVRLYGRVFSEQPWSETWSTEAALQVVCDPLLRWWVASDEAGEVVGFVAGVVATPQEIATRFEIPLDILKGRVGYKSELGVAPELRRAGLARRLTAELLDWFREEYVEQFIVRTRPGTGNEPWYAGALTPLAVYPDGRVLFGHPGVPKL